MSQVCLVSPSAPSFPAIAYKNTPVLTSELLAQAYEVKLAQIQQNYANNKERFVEGKHFFLISGNDLKEFKNSLENFESVQIAKRTPSLTLWTERGAARHAKMLNSDKAWDVFELLEETFFRVAAEHSDSTPSSAILSPAHRSELKGIVDAKLSTYPASVQGKARSEIWTRFNRHFRIAEYAQLPAERMAEARDYLIELEVRALKALPSTPPALSPASEFAFRTEFPADMHTGRKDALRKIQNLMAGVTAARDVVRLFCHPGGKSMRMTLDEKKIYDALYQLYCAADDSLLAAYRALDAGYRLGRQYGRG